MFCFEEAAQDIRKWGGGEDLSKSRVVIPNTKNYKSGKIATLLDGFETCFIRRTCTISELQNGSFLL
jgi:hypothetical protein